MAYRFIKKTIYDQVRGNHLQAVQKLLSDFRNNPLWLDLSPFGPGRSAIYIAAYYNHPLMIFLLSKNGIDVDKKEHKRGETPLWMAVYWNQLDAVRALILCHANVHTHYF